MIKSSVAALVATAGLVLAQPAFSQTPLFGGFGQSAWSRSYSYIQSRFGAIAKDEMVIVLPTATDAWNDSNKVARLMEMNRWGETQPERSWQYGPGAGRRISEGYQYFLDAAFVAQLDANGAASADLKNAIRRSSEEVEFTRTDYNQTSRFAEQAYASYWVAASPGGRMSKDAFYKDQGWGAQIKAKKDRLDDAVRTFQTIADSLVDPDLQLLTRAKLKLENPNQKIRLPAARETLNNPELWQSYYISLIGGDLDAFMREYKPQIDLINEAQSQSDIFEQTWRASVSVSFLGLFRAGGASAEQTTREKHIQDNATNISVSFDNLDVFPVTRGEWFDGSALARFSSSLPPKAFNAVFGPNGQLEVIPSAILVGRGMRISIYADSTSLDYLYQHFEGGADAGVFVGWFKIGGSGHYSTTHENVKVTRFADHIEFMDLSGRPQVLAMRAKTYGVNRPAPTIASASLMSFVANLPKPASKAWSVSDSLSPVLKAMSPQEKALVTQK
jgi:hypothetical protein